MSDRIGTGRRAAGRADQVDLDQRILTRRPVVPTVVRAGGTAKYCFQTSSKPAKSCEVRQEHLRLDDLIERDPAASKVCFRFSRI